MGVISILKFRSRCQRLPDGDKLIDGFIWMIRVK